MLISLNRPGPGRAASSVLPLDGYVTDGRRLFRVVSQFATVGDHVFASLEDCLTLQVQPYSPGEIDRLRLRPVGKPAGECVA